MAFRDWIKTFFSKDKEQKVADEARGISAGAVPSSSMGAPWEDGQTSYSALGQMLSIDSDLMRRYADYENMDDYPETSAALDNYADCATIPDSVHGKTIWATSRDKIVRDLADDCLHRRIRIEEDIWPAVRTLCKYGNCYAEVLVSEIGVVGLNWLPVPTVRRIVDDRGSLIGFVQDTTGSFGFDYKAVVEAMKNSRLPDTEGDPKDAKLIFFRTWELVHWRLRSKMIRAQYGYSVLDAARWVWKRLVLMEDTALVQKLCLHGDTKIWTSCGVKNIRDLAEGDEVYSYTVDDELKKTRVVYKKHNGKDKIFRIKSAHRELYANETHPVLVEEIIHGGSGRSLARSVKYVEVKDLEPGVHRWMTPCKEDHLSEDVELLFPALDKKARLSVSAIEDGVELTVGPKRIHDEFGADIGYVRDFFGGERWMTAGTIGRILEANGTSLDYLDYKDDWGGADGSRLPKYASDDFARLFGFLIGNGFASERKFEKDGRECFVRTVGFSAGDNEEINEKYRVLFENFFGHAGFVRDKRSQHGCVGYYYVSSKKLYEFMVLNGFIPGAHNKRVPEWVFRSPVSVRQAFLDGLADADGYTEDCNVSTERNRVRHKRVVLEMCNKDLVEDVRDLAMQLGFRVGSVRSRVREGGRSIDDDRFVLGDARSYTVEWSYDRQPISEVLNSVESVDVDDIWDIGVESDEHNFVANGVVVHNTRAPGRYAFYVDTGDLPPREAMALVKKVKRAYKKKSLLDPATGNLDFRYNPLSPHEDFFIPTRGGKESTRIEVMSGPDVQMMDDVEYFQGKLVAATKVPKSYMGLGESADETSKSLSQADVRFARACMRVQREFIMGVRKIIRVHLAALNIDPESAMWTIKMTVPSAIFEMQQIEILNAQAALASSMTEWTSKPWILQHIFHFSEDDAAFISRDKDDESDDMAKKEAGTQADIMRLYPELQEMPPVAEEPPMGESDLGNEIIGLKKMFEETGQTYPLMVKRFEKLESMMTGMQKSLKMRAVSGGRR